MLVYPDIKEYKMVWLAAYNQFLWGGSSGHPRTGNSGTAQSTVVKNISFTRFEPRNWRSFRMVYVFLDFHLTPGCHAVWLVFFSEKTMKYWIHMSIFCWSVHAAVSFMKNLCGEMPCAKPCVLQSLCPSCSRKRWIFRSTVTVTDTLDLPPKQGANQLPALPARQPASCRWVFPAQASPMAWNGMEMVETSQVGCEEFGFQGGEFHPCKAWVHVNNDIRNIYNNILYHYTLVPLICTAPGCVRNPALLVHPRMKPHFVCMKYLPCFQALIPGILVLEYGCCGSQLFCWWGH